MDIQKAEIAQGAAEQVIASKLKRKHSFESSDLNIKALAEKKEATLIC